MYHYLVIRLYSLTLPELALVCALYFLLGWIWAWVRQEKRIRTLRLKVMQDRVDLVNNAAKDAMIAKEALLPVLEQLWEKSTDIKYGIAIRDCMKAITDFKLPPAPPPDTGAIVKKGI